MPSFTTILLTQGNNVGIEVPADVVRGFDAGKRVPVRVTLNGFTYASTIAVMGGRYLIPVSKQVCTEAGVTGGEQHEVVLEHDTSPRGVERPDDLAAALEAAGLRVAYDALSPSRRKEHVRQVTRPRRHRPGAGACPRSWSRSRPPDPMATNGRCAVGS